MEKVRNPGKAPLVMLMMEAMSDTRSVTGSNYRNIMLQIAKTSVNDVEVEDAGKIKHFKFKDEDKWKVSIAMEVIETKANKMEVPGFDIDELEEIMNHIYMHRVE